MINRLNFKSIVRGTSHIRRPHMYATKKLIKLSLRAIASKIAPYIKTDTYESKHSRKRNRIILMDFAWITMTVTVYDFSSDENHIQSSNCESERRAHTPTPHMMRTTAAILQCDHCLCHTQFEMGFHYVSFVIRLVLVFKCFPHLYKRY